MTTLVRPFLHVARATLVAFTPLFLASSVIAQTTATPRRLRDVVTNDALFYLDAPDFQSTLKRGKDIAIARIAREEEFQQFLGPAWKTVRGEIDKNLKMFGQKPENWQSCPFKSIELAVGRIQAGAPLGLFAKIDTGMLGDMLRKFANENPEDFSKEDVKGDLILGPPMNKMDEQGAPRVAIGISGESILLTILPPGDKNAAFDTMKRALQQLKSPENKDSLAVDAQFMGLTSKFQAKTAEWNIFLRPAAALAEIERFASQASGLDAAEKSGKDLPDEQKEVKQILAIVKAVSRELGFSGISAVAITESYAAGSVTTETVIANEGEPRGLLAFGSNVKPLDRALIEKAFDGVDSFSVSSMEPRALYDGIYNSLTAATTILGPAADRQFPALKLLASYEKEHNIKIGDDFFGALGSTVYSYSFPPKAGSTVPLPDSFVAIRLKDKVKFEKCVKEFVASAAQVPDVKIEVSEGSSSRPAVYALRLEPREGGMMGGQAAQLGMLLQQVGLALAITDEWALLGMNPVAMKNELRKMSKPRDVSAEAKKLFAEAPAETTAFMYHDWKPTIRTTWDTLASLASLAGGEMEDLPVNLQEIPTSQSIVKHLRSSYSYTVSTKGGSYTKSVGSFGFEVLGSALAIGGGVAFYSRAMAAGAMADFANEQEMPEVAAAEAEMAKTAPAPLTTTRTTLKKVEVGINVYKAEKGQYPESLAILLQPNDDHPQGYMIGLKGSPVDGWGNLVIYERATDGSGFKLRSVGPNGKDDQGEVDDVR